MSAVGSSFDFKGGRTLHSLSLDLPNQASLKSTSLQIANTNTGEHTGPVKLGGEDASVKNYVAQLTNTSSGMNGSLGTTMANGAGGAGGVGALRTLAQLLTPPQVKVAQIVAGVIVAGAGYVLTRKPTETVPANKGTDVLVDEPAWTQRRDVNPRLLLEDTANAFGNESYRLAPPRENWNGVWDLPIHTDTEPGIPGKVGLPADVLDQSTKGRATLEEPGKIAGLDGVPNGDDRVRTIGEKQNGGYQEVKAERGGHILLSTSEPSTDKPRIQEVSDIDKHNISGADVSLTSNVYRYDGQDASLDAELTHRGELILNPPGRSLVNTNDQSVFVDKLLGDLNTQGRDVHSITFITQQGVDSEFEILKSRLGSHEQIDVQLGDTDIEKLLSQYGAYGPISIRAHDEGGQQFISVTSKVADIKFNPQAAQWNQMVLRQTPISDQKLLTKDGLGLLHPVGNIEPDRAVTIDEILDSQGQMVPGSTGARLFGNHVVYGDVAKLSQELGSGVYAGGVEASVTVGQHAEESTQGSRPWHLSSGTPYETTAQIFSGGYEARSANSYELPPVDMLHVHPYDSLTGKTYPNASSGDQKSLHQQLNELREVNPNQQRQHSRIVSLKPDGGHDVTFYGEHRLLKPMSTLSGIRGDATVKVEMRSMNNMPTVRLSHVQNDVDIEAVISKLRQLPELEGHREFLVEVDYTSDINSGVRTHVVDYVGRDADRSRSLTRNVYYDFSSGAEKHNSTSVDDIKSWLLVWKERVPQGVTPNAQLFEYKNYDGLADSFVFDSDEMTYKYSQGDSIRIEAEVVGPMIFYKPKFVNVDEAVRRNIEVDLVSALLQRLERDGATPNSIYITDATISVDQLTPEFEMSGVYYDGIRLWDRSSVRAWRHQGYETGDLDILDDGSIELSMHPSEDLY